MSSDVVHRYVELAIALGNRDPDSIDFYVAGGDSRRAEADRPDLKTLHSRAVALRDDIVKQAGESSLGANRRRFLLDQVGALIFRMEQLSGQTRSFDVESRILFGVVAPPDDKAPERSAARKQLRQLLRSSGELAAAYSRYDARFVVPPGRLSAVMQAALQSCRALTLQHVSLPPNEHVRVEYVSHKPWSAFSRYLGDAQSVIEVNTDYPLTVDRVLNLACHEAYPGHHVFNLLRDEKLVREMGREEFRVQPTFSPQSYLSEAAATYAPTLAMSDAERAKIEREVLFPMAGLNGGAAGRYVEVQKLVASLHTAEPSIAREYLDGNLEFVRAADALQHETAMEHSETTLLYLNEFRTYMLTYTLGLDEVKAFLEAGDPRVPEKWQRYLSLVVMQQMH